MIHPLQLMPRFRRLQLVPLACLYLSPDLRPLCLMSSLLFRVKLPFVLEVGSPAAVPLASFSVERPCVGASSAEMAPCEEGDY